MLSSKSENGDVTSSSVVHGGGSGQSFNSFNRFGIELVLEYEPDFLLRLPTTFVLPKKVNNYHKIRYRYTYNAESLFLFDWRKLTSDSSRVPVLTSNDHTIF